MTIHDASDVLLGWIIRGIGLLWVGGTIALFVTLRRQAVLDGMISRIGDMTRDFEATPDAVDPAAASDTDDGGFMDMDRPMEPRERDPAREAEEAWIDRDDRRRRRLLAINGVVLGLCAVAMLMLHPFAVWLVALLVGGQGVYFIQRERAAREAPTADAAAGARPEQSTRNAGWFSLAAAGLVWLAAYRSLLG